jgi:hypothetical protein
VIHGATRVRAHAVLEDVVESGIGTTAVALAKIRDERLYRLTHTEFETYCHERFGMGRSYVNRVIAVARVAEVLGPMGPTPTEGQARELKSLPDEEIRETWQAAAEQAAERGRATPTCGRHGAAEIAAVPAVDPSRAPTSPITNVRPV